MAIEQWRPSALRRRSMGDPFRMLDDMMSRFWSDWGTPRVSGESRGFEPAIDMVDRKDEICVRADLPGLEQKDLQVHVDNGMLTIRGERREEKETKDEDYYAMERWSGAFSRTMMLPPGIDADKIKANFKNGVLEVHIPKSKQAAGKTIEVQAA